MIRRAAVLVLITFAMASLGGRPARALPIEKTATTDGLRIELHVMEAEPFYTAEQVKADPELKGMLIVGGAGPLAPDSEAHPNCHLIVHVFDARTGQPLTDAKVSMEYQMLDREGRSQGMATEVPVVVMQVIGKGPASTHYGNNVVLPDGNYRVTVVANGKKAEFDIAVGSG